MENFKFDLNDIEKINLSGNIYGVDLNLSAKKKLFCLDINDFIIKYQNEPNNDKKPIIDNNPTNKRITRSSKNNIPNELNNAKKNDNYDKILNELFGNPTIDDDEDEIECNNPKCDHKDYTKEELIEQTHTKKLAPIEINDIIDLIELGKTYHCKKNRSYHGINLRILCNLVQPLTELKNLIGMKSVKENIVNQIIFFILGFNHTKKCNSCIDCTYDLPCPKNLNKEMLHTVITGPPGVGKTELGKILGKIYKSMGILTKGHINIATRSDLIGKYLGHTSQKTQSFIDKCRGGVMFIDEAYSLGNPEGKDSFSKECIDTINQNLTERRDFLCIIAGYADALEKCFFAYNPGLSRRFTFRYDISGYSAEELMDIFLLKVKKGGWNTEFDEKNKIQLLNFFNQNLEFFPFFGGDIESFFLNCQIVHSKRIIFKELSIRKILTAHDIQEGFNLFVIHRKYKELKEEIPMSVRMMYL
ncbi:AAA family ATPase [uncultured virus]|nr:AAA family ATPase [uncultured virus]